MSDITSTALDTKSWWQSRTIIGSLIAVLAVLARLLGYEIGDADQAALIDGASTLAGLVGGGLAIWGRVAATKAIGAAAK